jgi:hypothetical protein
MDGNEQKCRHDTGVRQLQGYSREGDGVDAGFWNGRVDPLPEREPPLFHVIGFSAFLSDRPVLLLGNHVAGTHPEGR